ncbi:MAG: MFS transporter [Chloroflexi bacterium]|nr:MFS transporter [Chloroflexota bacterium]
MTSNSFNRAAQQRITAALFVSQSLFSAAIIASFTLMPILATSLSGRESAAGIPGTLSLIGRAAAAYPMGWLMDRAGRRLGLTLGFGFAALGSGIAIVSIMGSSFIGFCIGALFAGFGRSSSEQARYVAAEVSPTDRRAKVVGLIVFAGTIGAVGGPLIVAPSGQFIERFGLLADTGPFVAATVFYLIALLIAFLFLRPDPLTIGRSLAVEEETDEPEGEERPLRQIFARPLVQLAIAAMVIGQLVMVLLMTITPLHMNHNGHGIQAISWVIMAHTLGMFGLSGVTGWLIDRYGRILTIVIGALILIISSILTPLSVEAPSFVMDLINAIVRTPISAGVPPLAMSLFLLGLGWNFCFIAGSSLLSDALASHERGRVQGVGEMLVALAAGMGSFSTGGVFEVGGITAVSAVGLAFSLVLVALLTWFNLSQKTRQAEAL